MTRAFGMHRVAVQHARLADSEVSDIDHLLYFAIAFGLDLAHLQCDQATQGILVLAQRFAAQTNRLATTRRGRGAPDFEGRLRTLHDQLVVRLGAGLNPRDDLVVAGVDRFQHTGVRGRRPLAIAKIGTGVAVGQAERLQDMRCHKDSLSNGGRIANGTGDDLRTMQRLGGCVATV